MSHHTYEKPKIFTGAIWARNIKERWPDFVIMCLLWVGSATVNLGYLSDLPDRFFVERDPALSYPAPTVATTEVQNWTIFFLGLAICMICIWIAQMIVYFTPSAKILYRNPRMAQLVVDPLFSFLCFTETMALTFFLDNSLKQFAGRMRPAFFAQCNYKGYATALKTGNFTSYFANTIPGAVGHLKYCLVTNPEKLANTKLSWPSTHSAWAFAGFGFLSIFLFWLVASVRVRTHSQMWKLFACFSPMIAPGLIATTRARDYYHTFDDIFAGSVLGLSIALFIFWLHYPPAPHFYAEENEFEDLNTANLPTMNLQDSTGNVNN